MLTENFHVGLKLSLAVNNSENRISMSLSGWVEETFILATGSPLRNIELTSSDDCIIRYVKEGVAFGFQTSMLLRQQHPLPIIFFKYPEVITSMPFRKTLRVKTNIRAKMKAQTGEKNFIIDDAKIMDLSETGCLLEIPSSGSEETRRSTKFCLTFMMLDKSLEIDCYTKGVRKRNDKHYLGSEFVNLDQATQEILKSFVSMFAIT